MLPPDHNRDPLVSFWLTKYRFRAQRPSSGEVVGESSRDLCSKALGDGLDDAVVFNVIRVVGLEFSGNTSQRTLQSLLGRSVNHLGLWKS